MSLLLRFCTRDVKIRNEREMHFQLKVQAREGASANGAGENILTA